MIDPYLQQWSAIQAVRAARLPVEDVVLSYLALSGSADGLDVEAYLAGLVVLPGLQRDLIAHAINELLDDIGAPTDGAHYRDDEATSGSGYEDYLRELILSPDGYDFAAPPAGDRSAIAMEWLPDWPASDPDEAEFRRCQALYATGLLATGAEERFDRIVREVRDHFGVSSASFALITADSQIIKSVVGPIGQNQPRDIALCATTIQADRTLIITDASTDPRWFTHPLVVDTPGIRFYAGHPITTADGWRIGSLCLIDDTPRAFTAADREALRRYALQAQTEVWV